MLIIGLTGGIGSGKTTVTHLFAQLGVPIIDADQIARELTESKSSAYQQILDKFGSTISDIEGRLDRKKLRQLIFSDDSAKKWLEELLHPLIRKAIATKLATLTAPYCIIVIPLLIETNAYNFLNRVLVVEADIELRISRIEIRDHLAKEEIMRIMNSQASSNDRLGVANDLIYNNDELEELKAKVAELHDFYTNLSVKYTTPD